MSTARVGRRPQLLVGAPCRGIVSRCADLVRASCGILRLGHPLPGRAAVEEGHEAGPGREEFPAADVECVTRAGLNSISSRAGRRSPARWADGQGSLTGSARNCAARSRRRTSRSIGVAAAQRAALPPTVRRKPFEPQRAMAGATGRHHVIARQGKAACARAVLHSIGQGGHTGRRRAARGRAIAPRRDAPPAHPFDPRQIGAVCPEDASTIIPPSSHRGARSGSGAILRLVRGRSAEPRSTTLTAAMGPFGRDADDEPVGLRPGRKNGRASGPKGPS